jgi:hypothetical protein
MADVRIRSGDVDNFSFGDTSTLTTTVNQVSNPLYKSGPLSCFQAILSSTTFNALTATIAIQVSNDIWTGVGFVVNSLVTTSGNAVVTSPLKEFGGQTEQLNDLFAPAVAVGMVVTGPGIPVGTYVATVTNSGSITLSQNATANSPTGGVSIRFFRTNWLATGIGTITLSGTTSATAPSITDGFTTEAPWKFVRANVTNITGTGATVSVVMGL